MTRVLVTGADGFVGRRVVGSLLRSGHEPVSVVRDDDCAARFQVVAPEAPLPMIVGDIGATTSWDEALEGVEAIIHLAARVHVMDERALDPLEAFRKVNTFGTERLAREAARTGVRRLVFVSTIKVLGESTTGRGPFGPEDPAAPADPYAISKHEAETALASVSEHTGLETVVLRPPLVHGPGVGGNLRRLLGWVAAGAPLPLGSVENRRSLIGVSNLADVLVRCVDAQCAAGRTYTVADTEDLSTPGIVRELAAGLGRPARLLPAPMGLVGALAKAMGKSAVLDRLAGSLQVDSARARQELQWQPALPIGEGLRAMARDFLREKQAARIPGR